MALLLKGARLVDPSVSLDTIGDVLVADDGTIAAVGETLDGAQATSLLDGSEHTDAGTATSLPLEVRDLTGRIIVPGLMDMHVHLREPGYEYKEDIASGGAAASKGGFTAILAMPNTKPVCDTGSRIAFVREQAAQSTRTRVYQAGALTKDLAGEMLSEMGDMVAEGAIAFTDDGRGVQDAGMMRRAMDYACQFGVPVLSHCQMEDLVGEGIVNEGRASTRLGMAGWPAQGEELQIARDIMLCELTSCPLHIQHITTRAGLDLVRAAKAKGLPVTCEATPHHLLLCEDDIGVEYDTALKMNPPLRSREDMRALREALLDGTVDCIATDHAPHAAHEKALEFELAPFGTIGLETALPLVLTELVAEGFLGYGRMVELMSSAPRRILGLDAVSLAPGSVADLTVIDPQASFTVERGGFVSKSHNSAFIGRHLTGRACDTYVGGRASLLDGKLVTR